jgi:hypothetical protein
MHKRVEQLLIASAIAIAAAYALLSYWPTGGPLPQSPAGPTLLQNDKPTDSVAETRRMEAEAISNLVKIGSAQLSFRALRKRFGSMEEITREGLISTRFSGGDAVGGYQYSMNATGEHFALYADPVAGSGRHFYIDETLDLRQDDYGRASASSPYLAYGRNEPAENKGAPNPPKP